MKTGVNLREVVARRIAAYEANKLNLVFGNNWRSRERLTTNSSGLISLSSSHASAISSSTSARDSTNSARFAFAASTYFSGTSPDRTVILWRRNIKKGELVGVGEQYLPLLSLVVDSFPSDKVDDTAYRNFVSSTNSIDVIQVHSPVKVGLSSHWKLNHSSVHSKLGSKLLQNSFRIRASAVNHQRS